MTGEEKITLTEARKRGKIEQFITEREKHLPGDQEAFDDTLNSMVGKSKPVPGTSNKGDHDG